MYIMNWEIKSLFKESLLKQSFSSNRAFQTTKQSTAVTADQQWSCTTLPLHGLQYAMLPCPLSPEVCSNSCQLNGWCQTTIPTSDTLFSCPQSFPASGPFPASWLFTSGGQSIQASASVLPNEYSAFISIRIDWFHLLAVQGTLKYLLQHHSSKASVLWCSAFFMVQLSHPYITTEKTIVLTWWTFVSSDVSAF